MKRDLFRRYVWLVDAVKQGKPTFEEIADEWLRSPLNDDGSPLALRTFHNHRDAIENLFGIRIPCDRSDHNRYYIADDGKKDSTRMKVWMLQTLSLSNTIHRQSDLDSRILLDVTPEEKFGMMTVIEAMKREKCIGFDYSVPSADGRTDFVIAPYCLRLWKSDWYLLGLDMETGSLRTFDLARIVSIYISTLKFRYPADFSGEEYFKNYFGMHVDSKEPVQTIRMRIYGHARDYIRTMPLHHTQREVQADHEYSVFTYNFVPTADFKRTILSMGHEVEILSPPSLRDSLREDIDKMQSRYAMPIAGGV